MLNVVKFPLAEIPVLNQNDDRPPTLTKNFKFQILPNHGKMTDPPTLTKNLKFQIWLGHGKMTDPPPLTKNFTFQIWLGHGKMTDPPPSLKTITPPLKILNFRFGLDLER